MVKRSEKGVPEGGPRVKLIALRKQGNYSQVDVAYACGLTEKAYREWELGRAEPSLSNAIKLSNFYRVPITTVIDALEIEPPLY